MKTVYINFSIPVGKYLRLGYRPIGAPAFIYVTPNLFFNQTPYELSLNSAFTYEFELTTICDGDCGDNVSNSIYIQEIP